MAATAAAISAVARARQILANRARTRAMAVSLRASHGKPMRPARKAISSGKTLAVRALNHGATNTMPSTTSNPPATPHPASRLPDNPQAAIAAVSAAHAPVVAVAEEAVARTAALAGATGLVGRAVLNRLLAADFYTVVHAVGRHPPALQHPRLVAHTAATFDSLDLPAIDDVFIALGTTLATAGSREAFAALDRDAVVKFAEAACASGARRIGVVSAMGANRVSRVFYNRVKGEMEAAIAGMHFETVVFARPSLLSGDRESLAQSHRPAEKLALFLTRWLKPLLPLSYRSIDAATVASALVKAVQTMGPGRHVLLSGALQKDADSFH